MNVLAVLLLFGCQDPIPPAPSPSSPRALDVVELKNGDTLEGRITAEVDGYVELELGPGASIGLSTATVAAIRRGAGATRAAAVDVPARSEWFVLHDAAGTAVGWLSTAVAPAPDGGFTISEEYEFVDGQRRFQVTSMASAAADRSPRSCYFRERVSEPVLASLQLQAADLGRQERVVDERIVEATCGDGRLRVQHLDRQGRRERELAWPAGASFPLLARTLARSAAAPVGPLTLFDPAGEELLVRSYDGSRRRRVLRDGKPETVYEIREQTATGRNHEWLDATHRTLRRELAGPALVALPSAADSMKRAVGAVTVPGAIVAEAGGTFGLWIPNPAWRARDEQPGGQVALVCEAHGATVALARLDHFEANTTLDAAAEAVGHWFQLLHPELQLGDREAITVRERAAVRLAAAGRRGVIAWRATVDVIPQRGHFLALVCVAPTLAWDELAGDFEFLRSSIELDAQSLAPRLQGPLALARDKAEPSPSKTIAAPPAPSAAPTPVGPTPVGPAPLGPKPAGNASAARPVVVRIPGDD